MEISKKRDKQELLHYVFIHVFPCPTVSRVTAKRIKASGLVIMKFESSGAHTSRPSNRANDMFDEGARLFSNSNPAMPFCKAKRHLGGCLRHPTGQGKNNYQQINNLIITGFSFVTIIIIIFRAYIPPIPDGNMSKYWRCSAWSSEREKMTPIARRLHNYNTHYNSAAGSPSPTPKAPTKRCVFRRALKLSTLGIDLSSRGNSFQIVGRNTDSLLRLNLELALTLVIFGCFNLYGSVTLVILVVLVRPQLSSSRRQRRDNCFMVEESSVMEISKKRDKQELLHYVFIHVFPCPTVSRVTAKRIKASGLVIMKLVHTHHVLQIVPMTCLMKEQGCFRILTLLCLFVKQKGIWVDAFGIQPGREKIIINKSII
eukprot:sb/3465827/